MRLLREVEKDLLVLAIIAAITLFAFRLAPKPHTHDGGRTWHAHGGVQ